jgi:SAM-dependent methyltransferase
MSHFDEADFRASTGADWRISANRESWNYAIRRHQVVRDDFTRTLSHTTFTAIPSGVSRLMPQELEGRRVLQLFCNNGRETLDFAWKGAVATGVDFAEDAISAAENLLQRSDVQCTFECAEVLDWLCREGWSSPAFDLVYTSLGSLWWLPNLHSYFTALKPRVANGSRYLIWEFHPLMRCFDTDLSIARHYPFESEGIEHLAGIEDYVSSAEDYYLPHRLPTPTEEFVNPYTAFEFRHSLASIVTAASSAGWRVDQLIEWPWIDWERFLPRLVQEPGQRYGWPSERCRLPLTFVLSLSFDGK